MISAEKKGKLMTIKIDSDPDTALEELVELTAAYFAQAMRDELTPEEIDDMYDCYGKMIRNMTMALRERVKDGNIRGTIIDGGNRGAKERRKWPWH